MNTKLKMFLLTTVALFCMLAPASARTRLIATDINCPHDGTVKCTQRALNSYELGFPVSVAADDHRIPSEPIRTRCISGTGSIQVNINWIDTSSINQTAVIALLPCGGDPTFSRAFFTPLGGSVMSYTITAIGDATFELYLVESKE